MFIYIAIETASFLAGINDWSQVFFKRSSPSLKKNVVFLEEKAYLPKNWMKKTWVMWMEGIMLLTTIVI